MEDAQSRLPKVVPPVPAVGKDKRIVNRKKVDVEKLKKSFAEDKWATVKTVLGSQPLFNYLQYERGTPLDEDTTVAGLDPEADAARPSALLQPSLLYDTLTFFCRGGAGTAGRSIVLMRVPNNKVARWVVMQNRE